MATIDTVLFVNVTRSSSELAEHGGGSDLEIFERENEFSPSARAGAAALLAQVREERGESHSFCLASESFYV